MFSPLCGNTPRCHPITQGQSIKVIGEDIIHHIHELWRGIGNTKKASPKTHIIPNAFWMWSSRCPVYILAFVSIPTSNQSCWTPWRHPDGQTSPPAKVKDTYSGWSLYSVNGNQYKTEGMPSFLGTNSTGCHERESEGRMDSCSSISWIWVLASVSSSGLNL